MRGYSIAAAWLNRCTSTARLLSEASSKMNRSFAESSPICQKGRRVGQAVGTGREVGGRGAGVNLPTTALQRVVRATFSTCSATCPTTYPTTCSTTWDIPPPTQTSQQQNHVLEALSALTALPQAPTLPHAPPTVRPELRALATLKSLAPLHSAPFPVPHPRTAHSSATRTSSCTRPQKP